ncbi:hypothetical protein THTE_0531 [Thermogutta terrifontis]|uniref:Uncharacterized protein n=1 Tax=Thermogutta terrifontis TaxID=1331910 RepID=A0A286RAZ2_9BACT|nr:hypothetical protein THTE_0531 [Thermogutta terrifontis]
MIHFSARARQAYPFEGFAEGSRLASPIQALEGSKTCVV